MKRLKYLVFFFIYPVALIAAGFLVGVTCVKIFYPGTFQIAQKSESPQEFADLSMLEKDGQNVTKQDMLSQDKFTQDSAGESDWQTITGTTPKVEESNVSSLSGADQEKDTSKEVSFLSQKLNANTAYVLEETDLRNDTVVETSWKLPAKYIGMNREQFIEAMELYEASPPLEELQRGFVSLQVLSFSPQKVVVQMNYEYIPPDASFYLMVEDNYVMVYLEDKKTLYMDTDISLKELPETLQQQIIQVMYIPNEESLYGFLENYSS